VCSMGDLFHEQVPDYYIDRVLAVMAAREQHTFLVLTKRPARMLAYLAAIPRMSVSLREAIALEFSSPDPWHEWPLPNVWLGVSVEDQQTADERIPLLLKCPAAVRFVSCEPLLGPVDLSLWLYRKHPPSGDLPSCHENLFWLDWIIVGGETGPGARPMHPQWARSIRDQCAAAGVPFFHKHHGEYICIPRDEITAEQQAEHERCRCHLIDSTGRRINAQIAGMAANHPDVHYAIRVGRQRAGRLLDGKLHDAMPEAR